MDRRYEARHVFMALTFMIAFLSPILLILMPFVISDLFNFSRDNWIVYLPFDIYLTYGIGLALWVISCLFLWLSNVKKWSIAFASLAVLGSGALFYFASQACIVVRDDVITVKPLFNEDQVYTWADVEKLVVYDVPYEEKGRSEIQLVFTDGEVVELVENGHVNAIKSRIFSKMRSMEKEIEYVAATEN